MGIVNVTPDSFSDGGRYFDTMRAVEHAQRLIDEGADILDIGGESSRPGAVAIPPDVELSRVMPVIEAMSGLPVPLSIDTTKPEVMQAALAAGVSIINDISGLASPGAVEVVANSAAAVVLMHMQGSPPTMQDEPSYVNVVTEVAAYLDGRIEAAVAGGIARNRIVLDPGFGFGKLLAHNLSLLRHLDELVGKGLPIMVGLSRKSMFKGFSSRPMDQRMPASLAGALIAVQHGARILRVHDVAATRDALAVWAAVEAAA